MNEERALQMRLAVLDALHQSKPYLVREDILMATIRIKVVPPPIATELAETLQWLDAKRWISGERPEMGGPIKWQLTELGEHHRKNS